MAQEFKDFDVLFKKQKRLHMLVARRNTSEVYQSTLESMQIQKRWVLTFKIWDQEWVQQCVYKEPDHEDWQLFRFSLKGLHTVEKLALLIVYKAYAFDKDIHQTVINCRVDNYIGALKRGGQLNDKLEIVK